MVRSDKQMEELSVAVHSGLLVLHSLATLFHLRKKDRSWVHVLAHVSGGVYSGLSLARHIRALKEDE